MHSLFDRKYEMNQREAIVMPALFSVGPLGLVAGIYSLTIMSGSNRSNQFYDVGWIVVWGLLIGSAMMLRTALGIIFKELVSLRQMLEAKTNGHQE